MKTVVIDTKNETIEWDNERIITTSHAIPVELIELLVLGSDTKISPKTLIKLTQKEISIMFISQDSKNMALTIAQNAKNSELKIAQYKALEENTNIAKYIIEKKLKTHKDSLDILDTKISIDDEISALNNAKSIDSILGIEGAFARKYFEIYFGLFEKRLAKGVRTKNPPLDPVNAMLSFVYTITYNQITAKLYARGFDPAISYLHTPFRSHYALSSDILETMRSMVNLFVHDLFKNNHLKIDDFSNKNGVYLKYNSRRELWKHLKPFMEAVSQKTNEEISILKKIITKSEEPDLL